MNISCKTKNEIIASLLPDYKHLVVSNPHESLKAYERYGDFVRISNREIPQTSEKEIWELLMEQCNLSMREVFKKYKLVPIAVAFYSVPDIDNIPNTDFWWTAWVDKKIGGTID